jgi:hypothetical protein
MLPTLPKFPGPPVAVDGFMPRDSGPKLGVEPSMSDIDLV